LGNQVFSTIRSESSTVRWLLAGYVALISFLLPIFESFIQLEPGNPLELEETTEVPSTFQPSLGRGGLTSVAYLSQIQNKPASPPHPKSINRELFSASSNDWKLLCCKAHAVSPPWDALCEISFDKDLLIVYCPADPCAHRSRRSPFNLFVSSRMANSFTVASK
jgi:hypothetical protein